MNEFALLEETNQTNDVYSSYYFYDPVCHICCFHSDQLLISLSKIERMRSQGFFLVGFIAYEAAYALDQTIIGKGNHYLSSHNFPLLHFIAFAKHKKLTLLESSYLLKNLQNDLISETFIYNKKIAIDEVNYSEKIDKILTLIHQGYTYQVNFTSKIHFDFQGDPIALYNSLKKRQKVSFSAYLSFKDYKILSLSPELFFAKHLDNLQTKPMKGTMPRSKDPKTDGANKNFLMSDQKSLAENLMIVDLLRNDLNKIAYPGSVTVPKLFSVESYQTVHQMVSSISCKINHNTPFTSILKALFPCGSITGAPKKKTMQIIHQLEEEPRKIYTGAIGYITPDNDMCFSVAIRTLLLEGRKGEMGVGGGIVADSKSKNEFNEMTLKAKFLTQVAVNFNLVETLFFSQPKGYSNLDLHLARLKNSASVFDFKIDADKIRQQLHRLTEKLTGLDTYKVRLELSKYGLPQISYQPLIKNSCNVSNLNVIICEHMIDSKNVLFQHKTTALSTRGFYNLQYQRYAKHGFSEVIFLNEQNHITEGTKTNLFIVKNNQWLTPQQSCGLLPGIMRSQIIQQKKVKAALITIDDLIDADEIWLTNSIIGIQRARITVHDPLNYH